MRLQTSFLFSLLSFSLSASAYPSDTDYELDILRRDLENSLFTFIEAREANAEAVQQSKKTASTKPRKSSGGGGSKGKSSKGKSSGGKSKKNAGPSKKGGSKGSGGGGKPFDNVLGLKGIHIENPYRSGNFKPARKESPANEMNFGPPLVDGGCTGNACA